jgi:hypothetical protein
MHTLTRQELSWMAEREEGPCVSMYLSLNRNPAASWQNALIFRGLLDQLEEALLDWKAVPSLQRTLIKPLRHLQQDRDFWGNTGTAEGLAVMRSTDFFRQYRLPCRCSEIADVADSFYLSPLLSALTAAKDYFVLLLGQKAVHLRRYRDGEFRDVSLPADTPSSLESLQTGATFAHSTPRHPAITNRPDGAQAGNPGGPGWSRADEKRLLRDFIRQVAHHVERRLQGEQAPLILVAVDYLHPMFHKACRYPHLLDQGIHGSPDELSEREIVDRAQPRVAGWSRQCQQQAYERCRRAIGSDRSSYRLEQLVPATHAGRIETLFAALGARRWGRYEPADDQVTTHATRAEGDMDLLDYAVRHTLLTGGTVYVVPSSELPDHGDFSAALRW